MDIFQIIIKISLGACQVFGEKYINISFFQYPAINEVLMMKFIIMSNNGLYV